MADARGEQILVVDDERNICKLLEAILNQAGYRVATANSGQEFVEAFDRVMPELCILDIGLPDIDGLKLLAKLREKAPDVPVIMLTGDGSAEHAAAAFRLKAFDYIVKPPNRDEFLNRVRNALTTSAQDREIKRLRAQVKEDYGFERIIGSGPRMREAKSFAQKFAASDATVLIRGESGTGKEVFARALHYSGPRAQGPFIDVNCAALTESLLESEIFGHEKGAFTGAVQRHVGKFEQAEGGTIFLDEIGDMPLPTQAKLLRVLQERSFQRVGGTEKVTVNVRVISATNQPLEKAVAEGKFRQDLFYRINTVTVEIPPLRDRREDLPELAAHFVALAARREGRALPTLSARALTALQSYAWPGNVRELENAMMRAVLLCEAGVIEPAHLPASIGSSAGGAIAAAPAPSDGSGNLVEAVEALERRMICEALEKSGWVKARAARALGVTERILSYKMDTYGIVRQGT